jgi:predicted  nucleic acid-binding Zn-ribbon protein
MVGRSKIVEISRNVPSTEAVQTNVQDEDVMIATAKQGYDDAHIEDASATAFEPDSGYLEAWEEEPATPTRQWKSIIIGALLLVACVAWTGFWAWANRDELLRPASPARIVELITLWAVPASLIALCWLLAMRLSSHEAKRFGDVAALLRTESEALEARIKIINGEITLARSFLAENARELESVGRASAKKLTEAADQLVTALADSDQKAQILQTVSSAAVSNLELLRNHLPVVTSAAKDATNQIGNAGNAANEQIQNLTASVRSISEASEATSATIQQLEQQSTHVAQKIGSAANEASSVLNTANSTNEERVISLLSKLQSETVDIEKRIGEAAENIEALSDTSAQRLHDHLAKLQTIIANVDAAATSHDKKISGIVSKLTTSLDDNEQKLAALNNETASHFESMISRVDSLINDCDERLAAIDESATDRIAKLAFAITALSESSGELVINLSGNEERAAAMLADAEKVMASLGNVSRELGETIPAAFDNVQKRLVDTNAAIVAVRSESAAIETQSASIKTRLTDLDDLLQSQRASVEAMLGENGASLDERKRQIDELSASLNATHSLIADVAATAEEQLTGSLKRVSDAAREAANSSKTIVEAELADIGERLTEQNKALLAGAIDAQLASLGSAVNDAVNRNITLSEEAANRVAAQLQSISELTANLEQRASVAREQFDGIDNDAFARRMALLTESLNSAAIDVAKILSNEVTDTAWASYLKGDRGVFTRRAVRLLDGGEARVIADYYNEDMEFRDHVNRYIHDFESMMRVLLSTRDGNAIGVTMLSSDIGKLYVALAQAIDRLRN